MREVSFLSAFIASLFLGGLGALTLVDLFNGPGTARQERVAATPAPIQKLAHIPRFLSDARYYLNNRYALKETFIAWNGAFKLNTWSHSAAPQVAIGQDGFLFLINDDTAGITQGQARLNPNEKMAWDAHFRAMEHAFSEQGIGFTFVIGPNKHTVYPDKLPSWLVPAALEATRVADITGIAQTAFQRGFSDSRRILRAGRQTYPGMDMYHPSDTHWTELGAALAVQDALATQGMDLPLPDVVRRNLPRSGDLARMIGQQGYWTAAAPVIASHWACQDTSGAALDVVTIDPLMPRRFNCGNPAGRPEKIVVFHDSFGVSAIPYLATHFQDVAFIWSDRVDPMQAADLDAAHVIFIQVERKMTTNSPERMLENAANNE